MKQVRKRAELDVEEFIRREFQTRRLVVDEPDIDWSPLVSYLDNQLY